MRKLLLSLFLLCLPLSAQENILCTVGEPCPVVFSGGTAADVSCTDCLNATEIEDIYLLNSGDTIAGDLNFADAAGNSPKSCFTSAGDPTFCLFAVDDDGIKIEVNDADTWAFRIDNAGAGGVHLIVDGPIWANAGGLLGGKLNITGTGTETCIDDNGADRLFHDTNCDGTKDAGEEFIDQVGGAGGFPREFIWPASALLQLEHAANSWADPVSESGTNVDLYTFAFNDSTDECVGQTLVVPADIDTAGTLTFTAIWYSGTATSGNIIWDFRHTSGQAEGVTWDTAMTTETAAADATQGTVDQITVTSWTETVSNAAWAGGDVVNFELCRDANNASDTLVGDAGLVAFKVSVPLA